MTPARGFSLVEVMVATLVLGGLFVAALSAVAAAKTGRIVADQGAAGYAFAGDLMAEVLAQAYAEGASLGPDVGETSFGNRTAFDDVDDYHGLTETTLRTRDGATIPDASGYQRDVAVHWVKSNDLNDAVSSDTGVKRIVVSVSWKGRPVAKLVALRTAGAPTPEQLYELPQ